MKRRTTAVKAGLFETHIATSISNRSPTVKSVSIRALKDSPFNARTHSEKQIDQLANSIARFGWPVPIVTDDDGVILAGHARKKAAEVLGLKVAPVIVLAGLTEAEKRAFILADNKIAANSGWDRKVLANELTELQSLLPHVDLDISITGFEAVEIDNLLGDLVDSEDEADQVPPVVRDPVSREGDLWLLGEHRVACGDTRDPAAMRLLMNFAKAAMVFADPPYNVAVKSIQGRGRIKHREFAAASGEMSKADFTSYLVDTLGAAAKHSEDGSIHYVCMDWRHFCELHAAGEEVFDELKNVVVWNKTNAGQGTFYRSQYELIFVFKVGESKHTNNFELGGNGRYRSNLWTYSGCNTFRAGRMDDLAMHPTVKPVALVADAMRDCSRRGDIVLDPFLGSGTTIMAAERVGRRGYGLEIDPLYVDVAVRRWQAFTKRDAVLADTGETFDEVAAKRLRKAAAL